MEWRELMSSRAWWVFLALMGPLVGVSFISAVNNYAEASGLNGTSAGVGEAFSPLIGVWAPTFSACELAAAFLLPFVAIRLIAGDRQSGAIKFELQHPMSSFERIWIKASVLLAGWLIATMAPLAAVAMWKIYGGSTYAPELFAVIAGHLLNAGLTIALAAAAASITAHPSTAAILTLSVTVGSWILSFIAAVHGGFWERAAGYTPTAMVAEFQHGLIRLDVALISLTFILGGLAIAAVCFRFGVARRKRAWESAALLALISVAIFACTFVRKSWDFSENRINSFSVADERALRQIHGPLQIEVHLAPEDPRRTDLDNRTLAKLQRIMPDLKVTYVSATSIGLFEQTSPHYGEIWYDANGQKVMSRVTTTEGVLETIYSLAGITPPENGDDTFRGHPLAAPPKGAVLIFCGIWPALVVMAAFFQYRRRQ